MQKPTEFDGKRIALEILGKISDLTNAVQQLAPTGMGEDYVQARDILLTGAAGETVRIEPAGQIGYLYFPRFPSTVRIWQGSVGGDYIGQWDQGQRLKLTTPALQTIVVEFPLGGDAETFTYWVSSRPFEFAENYPAMTDPDGIPVIIGDVIEVQRPVDGGSTITDASGTITTGGTSQQALAAGNRRTIIIQNPSGNATPLWFNFGVAAVQASPSIELVAGAYWESPPFDVPTGSLNIIGPTTGKTFTVKVLG